MAYTKATRDGLMPAAKPSKDEMQLFEGRGYSDGVVPRHVNLDLLDVHRLTSELIAKYNQKNDVGIIANFFRRCTNQQQKKTLDSVLELVQAVRDHSQSLMEYKAQLVAQRETFELIVQGKIEEAQYAIDRIREDHITFLHSQNIQRAQSDVALARSKKELELLEAQIAREYAEVGLINRQGEIMDTIRKEISFREMPPLMQAIVLIKAINPMANMDVDAVLKDKVLSAQLEKMAAEVENMNAKTAQEKVKAQYEEWKAREEMKGPAHV